MKPIRLKGKAYADLRAKVMVRDGWRCQRCGRFVSDSVHEVDDAKAHLAHIVPRSRGGPDTPENTECACRHCHMVIEHANGGMPKIVPAKEKA